MSPVQKVVLKVSVLINLILVLYMALYTAPESQKELRHLDPAPIGRNIQFFAGVEYDNLVNSSSSPAPPPPVPQENRREKDGEEQEIGRREISPGSFCQDKDLTFRQGLRGKYWVLYNYVTAEKSFSCDASITYTTHADYTFMDNLEPLIDRWMGPVSLAVYAPGEDFMNSIKTILYFRNCLASELVRDYTTFHLFFDWEHTPLSVPTQQQLKDMTVNCSEMELRSEEYLTYKKLKKLDYPVNIARNVARETAQTHFVFPSDIELYPSPGTIPSFLEMVATGLGPGSPLKPRVYVNSIFEINITATHLPREKSELVSMIQSGLVIPFHKLVCPACHNIPFSKNWTEAPVKPGMSVLHVGKRVSPYQHWEPIYIGTNNEPVYDERLTWEGRADKMTQGYKMCVLDYEFHILDNAFLIHRPGIKTKEILRSHMDNKKVAAQNSVIRKTIFPQVKKIYGTRKGCEII